MQRVCRFGCTVGAFPQGGFAIGVADVLTVAWAELTALIGWGGVWWSRVVFMIIIAFHTTADAFGFEEIAKRCGLEGRLGTIPRSISAGCGFAWLVEQGSRERLQRFIVQQELKCEGIYEQ